ncbi:MAG: squalene synthase HpnC [Gammaproteobacteria bacterium]|jgi:hydroxysqualene synthase
MTDDTLDNAYRTCLQTAQQHYENFPTAARLLAKPHRRATAAIYAFARGADDIADEGAIPAAERHQHLDHYAQQLSLIQAGIVPTEPVFLALADTIQRYQLPIEPFTRLLQAFRQDIDIKRYADFAALANYCHCSANPVGELILRLHGIWNEPNAFFSNQICTALQLINFIQDLDSDCHQRNRIYLPQDECQQFGVKETDLIQHRQSDNLRRLIDFQIARACDMLHSGVPLLRACPFRLRLILKTTVMSADCLITKLKRRQNVFIRPVLHGPDLMQIALRSLLFQPVKASC